MISMLAAGAGKVFLYFQRLPSTFQSHCSRLSRMFLLGYPRIARVSMQVRRIDAGVVLNFRLT
jgi:hypothetical protein